VPFFQSAKDALSEHTEQFAYLKVYDARHASQRRLVLSTHIEEGL